MYKIKTSGSLLKLLTNIKIYPELFILEISRKNLAIIIFIGGDKN